MRPGSPRLTEAPTSSAATGRDGCRPRSGGRLRWAVRLATALRARPAAPQPARCSQKIRRAVVCSQQAIAAPLHQTLAKGRRWNRRPRSGRARPAATILSHARRARSDCSGFSLSMAIRPRSASPAAAMLARRPVPLDGRGEIPIAAAVSSTDMPPRIRHSTIPRWWGLTRSSRSSASSIATRRSVCRLLVPAARRAPAATSFSDTVRTSRPRFLARRSRA